MNTIKEVLRLKYLGKLSNRNIELLGLASKSAVSNYITKFTKSGLSINDALAMKDESLFALFYPELQQSSKDTSKPHPDWSYVHNELKKKGMTRQLLWEEYKEQRPDGYGITQFKEYYSRYAKTVNPSMCQTNSKIGQLN